MRAWMLHTPQKKPPRLDREETTLQRLYHPYRRLFHCDGVRKKKKGMARNEGWLGAVRRKS